MARPSRAEVTAMMGTDLAQRPAGRLLVCGVLALALLLSACSRRQSEWEAARAADTVESYERFLKSFPEGEFSSQAQARMKELREARDWQKAVATNTLAGYQQFVAQYPDGRMSDEARIRIEGLSFAAAAPPDAAATNVPGVEMPPAPATAPPPPVTGDYRVQLGAFSGGEKQAMSEWRRLRSEYPRFFDELTPTVKLSTTDSGHLYRLQAGLISESRARDICTKLKTEGQACVVVPP
jgi:SPOR domain